MSPGVSDDWVRAELERLRRWRHDKVTPELASALTMLHEHERRLAEIEPRLLALARADEIASAVAERMQAERRGIFTFTEKLGGAFVGGAVIVDAILRATGH